MRSHHEVMGTLHMALALPISPQGRCKQKRETTLRAWRPKKTRRDGSTNTSYDFWRGIMRPRFRR